MAQEARYGIKETTFISSNGLSDNFYSIIGSQLELLVSGANTNSDPNRHQWNKAASSNGRGMHGKDADD